MAGRVRLTARLRTLALPAALGIALLGALVAVHSGCVYGVSRGGQEPLWLVAPPGGRADVGESTIEMDLVKRFGVSNVRPGLIAIGEGNDQDGTVVFPDDPERRLEIVWKDAKWHRHPRWVQVSGSRSRWTVAPGITLGTSLAEIESLNGSSFTLSGFDYDYSGTVLDFRGGKLQGLKGGQPRVILRLQPESGLQAQVPEVYQQVLGARSFGSDHPSMQRLNPRVYAIVLVFAEPAATPGR